MCSMRLFAALLPPPDVLVRVRSVVDSVEVEPERPVETGPPGRHRLARRRQAEVVAAPPPPPSGPMLDLVPAPALHLPIAKFGNVTMNDATRLANSMDRDARTWQTPRLRLAGGLALEPEGDYSVWVRLAGDVDALGTVRHGVTRVAQGLHLFVDRRVFRPEVQLGMVNDRTTAAYLEELLAALDAFESAAWWQTTVSLLVPVDQGPGKPPFKTFRDIPLGPAVAH
jgi:2'-5' RNA ligase